MNRLRVLTWHIHGSYLNALARVDHDWFLPVKPGRPEGYGGRGWTFDLPANLREIPAEQVRVTFFERLGENPHAYMTELSGFLGIDARHWDTFGFPKSNVTFSGRHQGLHRLARRLSKARRGMKGDRITDNTLVRVAVDLLLQHGDDLTGHDEATLLESLRRLGRKRG